MGDTLNIAQALETGLEHLDKQHDLQIAESARTQLLAYVALLQKWNRVYNLTAVRDPVAMVQRHLLDSLVLSRWLPEVSSVQSDRVDLVDIGSGAGLPVLPLAIARPNLTFASVESNGKKTRFQHQVTLELGLNNVQIINDRVQNISLKADVVTSRAFTAPAQFLNIANTLCAENALVIIMLAHSDALPNPLPKEFSLQELVPVDILGSSGPRHIALCRRLP